MALAAFTQPEIVEMVEAAALLCPISYLEHVSAQFVLRMVNMHLDQVSFAFRHVWITVWKHFLMVQIDISVLFGQMILAMGIHQLNFRRFCSIYIPFLSFILFVNSSMYTDITMSYLFSAMWEFTF